MTSAPVIQLIIKNTFKKIGSLAVITLIFVGVGFIRPVLIGFDESNPYLLIDRRDACPTIKKISFSPSLSLDSRFRGNDIKNAGMTERKQPSQSQCFRPKLCVLPFRIVCLSQLFLFSSMQSLPFVFLIL